MSNPGTGCTVLELMSKITHREYLLRCALLSLEEEIPIRLEWYLMQVAREVRLVLASTEVRNQTPLSSFKLKTETKPKRPKKQEPIDNRALWLKAVGYGRRS